MPLEAFDSNVESIFNVQLETGDRVLKWNAAAQAYETATRTAEGWTAESPAMTLSPGEAFWIESGRTTSRMVYVFGRVVLEEERATVFQPGLNAQGYPYTTAWDDWLMGQGYWFENTSETPAGLDFTRPYEDHFAEDDAAPSIIDMEAVPGGVKLHVMVEGLEGRTLAILYQDLAATGLLLTAQGWAVAEPGLVVGSETLAWVDQGAPGRPAPSAVFARLYLALPADLDANGNGIPDIREGLDIGSIAGHAVSGGGAENAAGTDVSETGSPSESIQAPDGTNVVSTGYIIAYLPGPVYVDAARGEDHFSGTRAERLASDGPKRTIRAGLGVVDRAGVLVIQSGAYGEDLNIAERNVHVQIEGDVVLSGSGRAPVAMVPPPESYTNAAGVVERRMEP